jgi:hypothetical protein
MPLFNFVAEALRVLGLLFEPSQVAIDPACDERRRRHREQEMIAVMDQLRRALATLGAHWDRWNHSVEARGASAPGPELPSSIVLPAERRMPAR